MSAEQQHKYTLLFVDDESNILSALKRLFRTEKEYKVFTATSGKDALELMKDQWMDIVVSDMRMPEMDGAEFLEKVAKKWPETIRILLTGYADMQSTVDAVNKGKIFSYESKPWNDEHFKTVIKQGAYKLFLEKERQRLQAVTIEQNRKLQDLNENLEQKVAERTKALEKASEELQQAYEKLKHGYQASIPVFAGLIELREKHLVGSSQKIANLAKGIAKKLELDEEEIEQIYFAALLHGIGKIAISDRIVNTSYYLLNPEQRKEYEEYPIIGETALMALEPLQQASHMIRHHREQYSGRGFPEKLSGDKIPLGSTIISLLVDYFLLQEGLISDKSCSTVEAQAIIFANEHNNYHPHVVKAFKQVLEEMPADSQGKVIAASQITGEVKLARDLVTPDGVLLLPEGNVVCESLVRKLQAMERNSNKKFMIYIK